MLYKEVDIETAIKYNPSAIKSPIHNSKRDKFFNEIDELSFEQLVKKFCTESVLERTKSKSKIMIYNFLKKVHFLELSKKIISKLNSK